MPFHGKRSQAHSPTQTYLLISLALVSLLTLFLANMTQKAHGDSLGLNNLPSPFITQDNSMNCSAVVASSVGHGPCGGCHTMDVMGAVMVAAGFGLKTDNGTMEGTMDDYISSYDFVTARVELRDLASNLIVVGGPGVNQITWYYNNLRNDSGERVLPVYFDKFPNGTDYIYVTQTNHRYIIQHDGLGRVSSDYGLVETFHDKGRHTLLLAGLGGSGTWAACKIASSYESWNLRGCAAIVRYRDTDSDGLLDELTIVEQVWGTIDILDFISPVSLGFFVAALMPKSKLLKMGFTHKRKLAVLCFLLLVIVASQATITVVSEDLGSGPYSFKELSHPFVSSGGLLNSTAVVASSVGHGPCGGCHTMDVMGAIMVGAQFGIDATGGTLEATLDDYISSYDMGMGNMTISPMTKNLFVVGGPGVNQITWYYNNLRNDSGERVLPVYFDKFPNGTDYIYVAATDHYYAIEFDGIGRVSADYGVAILSHDTAHEWWVAIAAGLGGPGTNAASRLLATYKSWSLFGQAIVVKYSDNNGDGYLDTLSVPEIVGVGESLDVFWDLDCRNAVGSIDWGALSPGDIKSVVVYVRNEGESGTLLALNASGWNPLLASDYLSVGWNYSGTLVQPGQIVPLALSLTVNENIADITSFGVNVTVSCGGS